MNIYDTRTMLAAIEMMKPARTFLKDTFFPTSETLPTEHVDVDYYKGRRKLAPFVSPIHAGKVVDREGFTTKTFKPAPIKPQRIITINDINRRSMGENFYSPKSPDERAAELLARDLMELDETITRREEWMAAQVLFTGQVRIKGEGVDRVLNFDFDNKETLSGTSKWNNAESDPIAYLKKKRLEVIKKSGVNPDTVIMSSDVVTEFIGHEKVKDALNTRRVELGVIQPNALPNGATYIGSLLELGLDIYSYDEWYFDEETREEKPMVPEGHIMIGSSTARSTFKYGSVTITEPTTGQFTTYEGERIPDTWISKNPDARFLQLHSLPLPIPHEVDSWYVSKVI